MEAAFQLKGELLQGEITKVRFRDESDGFTIASLRPEDTAGLPKAIVDEAGANGLAIKGAFARIGVGQRLRLIGKWTYSARYGWGFAVEAYEELPPNSREALIEYLSSGLFKGIGPKLAQAIVEKFGERTLEVIKEDPEALASVRGISLVKAQAIVEASRDAARFEELVLWLRPFHISTAKIMQIHQRYGEGAKKRIFSNPYCLCDDVQGIGFKVADAIAKFCNISPNNDYRIRAALIHTLNEATVEGHVFLPFGQLIQKTGNTLQDGSIGGDVDANDISRISLEMRNMDELVMEVEDNAVYLPALWNNECYVAQKLRALTSVQPPEFREAVEETIAKLEAKHGITYAEKQREAFRMLPEKKVMVITGGPGTGKTTIIQGIIEIYKRNFPGCKISLAAPTGRAAKRIEEATKMEAKTIHRLLEYRPTEDGWVECGRNEGNPLEADVLIIDETSMIDVALCATLLRAVRIGTTAVFVGDVDQLPSVGPGNVLKDIIASERVPVVRLNAIFRQAEGSKIVVNASKINQGDTELSFGDDFEFIEASDEELPALIKRIYLEEVARVGALFEVQVLTPFRKKTDIGSEALNKILQDAINPKASEKAEVKHGGRVFRKGDKVMQCRNNYEKEVFNGDMGTIELVDKDKVFVRIDENVVTYTKDDLDDLQLAYATTIHKAQGCEYDTVIIPLSFQHKRMLQRNLIYTGVTRAKKKVILVGDRRALSYAICNNHVEFRFSKLRSRINNLAHL